LRRDRIGRSMSFRRTQTGCGLQSREADGAGCQEPIAGHRLPVTSTATATTMVLQRRRAMAPRSAISTGTGPWIRRT
jgi:hypothetical protein